MLDANQSNIPDELGGILDKLYYSSRDTETYHTLSKPETAVALTLWRDTYAQRKSLEAKIETLKITHGHQKTGTKLNDDYFVHNITKLEAELAAIQGKEL